MMIYIGIVRHEAYSNVRLDYDGRRTEVEVFLQNLPRQRRMGRMCEICLWKLQGPDVVCTKIRAVCK